MSIDVTKAAQLAVDNLKTFYNTAGNIRMEEVELSNDSKFWNITLSYDDSAPPNSFVFNPPRAYRIIRINAENGEFTSMKIREFNK